MQAPQDAPFSLESPDIPYRAIVEQAVAGVYVMQDERFAYCNDKWADMLGRTKQQVIGASLAAFAPPGFLPELLRLYYRRLNGDPPSLHFVTRAMHSDGHERRIDVHGSRILFRDRPAVMGVGVDITEQLRNEEELRRSREQLRELSAYTARKLEEQRLEFARDIHDELGGILTSMKMDATRILRRVDTPELRELTEGLIALTQQSIETVKHISTSLRPNELDHIGLDGVIAREVREFGQRYGIVPELKVEAIPAERLPPRRANAVYRVFHESLTNVARHADARHIVVSLQVDGARLVLDLRDDGIGFDAHDPHQRALGLLSMRERAVEIGAELLIESSPGTGSRVRLSVPLI